MGRWGWDVGSMVTDSEIWAVEVLGTYYSGVVVVAAEEEKKGDGGSYSRQITRT
jgi:hypothetical protein